MIQLNEELLEALDREASRRGCSRSAVVRAAIEEHLAADAEAAKVRAYIEGYRRFPQGDVDEWGDLQAQLDRENRDEPATRGRGGRGRSVVVSRGEVWWYEPPDDLRRPYLILARDEALGALRSVLAVPATRTVRGIPTEVPLDEDDGMPVPCALTLDNATLVRRAYLTDRITTLSALRLRQVCEALAFATAC